MNAVLYRAGVQRGFVALLFLLPLVTVLLGVMLWWLDAGGVAQQRARLIHLHQQDLTQAADALLAYAATDLQRPGRLPCARRSNDDYWNLLQGKACRYQLGLFPALPTDYPPATRHGQTLWYVVSPAFSGNLREGRILNAHTQGSLQVIDANGQLLHDVAALLLLPKNAGGDEDFSRSPLATFSADSRFDLRDDRWQAARVIHGQTLLRVTQQRLANELRHCLLAQARVDGDLLPPAAVDDALGKSDAALFFGRVPQYAEGVMPAIAAQLSALAARFAQLTAPVSGAVASVEAMQQAVQQRQQAENLLFSINLYANQLYQMAHRLSVACAEFAEFAELASSAASLPRADGGAEQWLALSARAREGWQQVVAAQLDSGVIGRVTDSSHDWVSAEVLADITRRWDDAWQNGQDLAQILATASAAAQRLKAVSDELALAAQAAPADGAAIADDSLYALSEQRASRERQKQTETLLFGALAKNTQAWQSWLDSVLAAQTPSQAEKKLSAMPANLLAGEALLQEKKQALINALLATAQRFATATPRSWPILWHDKSCAPLGSYWVDDDWLSLFFYQRRWAAQHSSQGTVMTAAADSDGDANAAPLTLRGRASVTADVMVIGAGAELPAFCAAPSRTAGGKPLAAYLESCNAHVSRVNGSATPTREFCRPTNDPCVNDVLAYGRLSPSAVASANGNAVAAVVAEPASASALTAIRAAGGN